MNIENGPSHEDIQWEAEKPVEEPLETSGVKEYETVNGERVTLQWEAIYPEEGKPSQDEAIIFLPGVALDAHSKSVINSTKDLVNASKLTSYSISTRLENPEIENSQSLQAEAIQKFISEKGLKEITLVGNSQGANKAIFVNHELKHNSPDVKIRGLILTSPAGLYNQESPELTKNFFKDSIINTPPTVIKDSKVGSMNKIKNTLGRMGRSLRIGTDVSIGIGKEIISSPTQFSKRATRESTEAATRNPYTSEVECPIVIILGENDTAFKIDAFIPKSLHSKDLDSQKVREEYLKVIFPNSSAINVLLGSKDDNHGMYYIRGKKVPSSGWHSLERIERKLNKQ